MKNVTNALFVLFMLLGVGFVYAGYGVCIDPPEEITNTNAFVYYDSGRVSVHVYTQRTKYPDMYYEGTEGTCVMHEYNPDAVLYRFNMTTWFFNDTDDDFEKLREQWGPDITFTKGRHTCS